MLSTLHTFCILIIFFLSLGHFLFGYSYGLNLKRVKDTDTNELKGGPALAMIIKAALLAIFFEFES